jgi:glycerol kinase
MVANDWLLQFLADVLEVPVERPVVTETTALGAAQLAALGAGLIGSLEELSAGWRLDRRFEPRLDGAERRRLLEGWRDAVGRTLTRPRV